ncbi:hypothetical protein D3C78_992290 [compost metagenome]
MAGQPDLSEPLHKHSSSLGVGFNHSVLLLHSVSERLYRCNLADGWCAHDGILMDFQHSGYKLRMTACIADPPARHGKRLGEAAYEQRPLLHARQ